MNIGDLSLDRFATQLAKEGVAIRWGPFVSRIVSKLPELAAPIHLLYADFPIEPPGSICDFHICARPRSLRLSWSGSQGGALLDGAPLMPPYPRRWALPMFEWGLNACVYRSAHQFLIIHGAVVERPGCALILPGLPGAGKSTLARRWWRAAGGCCQTSLPCSVPPTDWCSLSPAPSRSRTTRSKSFVGSPPTGRSGRLPLIHTRARRRTCDRPPRAAAATPSLPAHAGRDAAVRARAAARSSPSKGSTSGSRREFAQLRDPGGDGVPHHGPSDRSRDRYRLEHASAGEAVRALEDLVRGLPAEGRHAAVSGWSWNCC